MIRKWFIAGLLVWIPVGVTIAIVRFIIGLLDVGMVLLPAAWRPERWLGIDLPIVGAIISVLIILLTGALAANILGRRLVDLSERLVQRIPVVRSLYGGAKSVAETLFSDSSDSFKQVLLIEYPRQGIWSIAFQTGRAAAEVAQRTQRECLSVFVPTTPNPTSGFIIMVPRDETIALDMTVEQGLRLIISLGVVTPDANSGVAAKSS